MFPVGSYVKVREGVSGADYLGPEGSVCEVVGVERDLRHIRRVDVATGALAGISVTFATAELEEARR